MVGFMSLQDEVINYLNSIRSDTKKTQRIDKYVKLVESHKNMQLVETRDYSKRIGGLVKLLFTEMPELEHADPHLQKVYPLYSYCENLPKVRKTPKRQHP
jgi:hypothetical protein